MLMAWKSEQYRRTGWIDFFDRPWIVDLVDDLFSTRTSHFGGLLSVLYAGETPVAAHFGLRSGHVLAHCYPAYDPRLGRHSPGLIHHLRMIEETAALGVHLIDMGRGPERYKQTLKNHDLYVAEGMVTRGPLHAAVHRARTGAVRWAGPQLRSIRSCSMPPTGSCGIRPDHLRAGEPGRYPPPGCPAPAAYTRPPTAVTVKLPPPTPAQAFAQGLGQLLHVVGNAGHVRPATMCSSTSCPFLAPGDRLPCPGDPRLFPRP